MNLNLLCSDGIKMKCTSGECKDCWNRPSAEIIKRNIQVIITTLKLLETSHSTIKSVNTLLCDHVVGNIDGAITSLTSELRRLETMLAKIEHSIK